MGGHHLVLGELRDYLTGEMRVDTHDERYRQKIVRLLVEGKGYPRNGLTAQVPIAVSARGRQAVVKIDLVLRLQGQIVLLVKYAPGSLTTRHQVALAASRLLGPRQVPFGVVTNGEDAEVLDNADATVLARGLDGIFSLQALEVQLQSRAIVTVTPRHREMALRILYAYEVDGRCPCDDTICDVKLP